MFYNLHNDMTKKEIAKDTEAPKETPLTLKEMYDESPLQLQQHINRLEAKVRDLEEKLTGIRQLAK